MKVRYVKADQCVDGVNWKSWAGFACHECIGATNFSGIGFPRLVGEKGPEVDGLCHAYWWICEMDREDREKSDE